jgi:hypothetical protein
MIRAITWLLRWHPQSSSTAVAPVNPVSAGPEDRGSPRMLLAAAMLRNGDDIDRIAAVSDVPAALLHLMRDELSRTESPRLHVTEELRPRRRNRHASRRFTAVMVIEIAVAANIAGCVAALLLHNTGLVVLTVVIAGSLILAVSLLARLPFFSAGVRSGSHRPASGGRDQR